MKNSFKQEILHEETQKQIPVMPSVGSDDHLHGPVYSGKRHRRAAACCGRQHHHSGAVHHNGSDLCYGTGNRMRLCNCHISSSLSCISRISALYALPPALTRLAIWLMFRPMADRATFIRLISVVSGWMIYPSIAIFRIYAPYRRVGSYAIFSSTSRFSSSVT